MENNRGGCLECLNGRYGTVGSYAIAYCTNASRGLSAIAEFLVFRQIARKMVRCIMRMQKDVTLNIS